MFIIENRAYVRFNKKGQESRENSTIMYFYPSFFQFRIFRMLNPQQKKWHVFLEVLGEDKAFYFSKRALRADTEHNKLLK